MNEGIVRALAYFDIFSRPLTIAEIERLAWGQRIDAAQARASIDELIRAGKIEKKDDWYFLVGRSEIVTTHQKSLAVVEKKLRVARRAAALIRAVPFLRGIYVCNSVGALCAHEHSDIDFFIVSASGRAWVVRFFASLILRIFGLRTFGRQLSDRVCLSFFVDSDHLDFSDLRVASDDVYLSYWLTALLPIYEEGDWRARLWRVNQWARGFLPNWENPEKFETKKLSRPESIWKNAWEKMWSGAYGDMIAGQMRSWQMSRMKARVINQSKQNDKGVILADGLIKLHENDRRRYYRDLWLKNQI